MSAVSQVSSFQFPVSSEESQGLQLAELMSAFAARLKPCPFPKAVLFPKPYPSPSHGGAVPQRSVELPTVMLASRLEDRPAAATVRSGIEELDALTGGLPRGGLSEICGPASSGRSSVLLAMMARMTAEGEVCALVDASDSFDPKSAEAAGVELKRVLWVRCSKDKSRADGCRASGQWSVGSGQKKAANRKSHMDSLEQALKATDLLLQGGGFGLVVVDLGDVPTQAARRVPLTSWFRFRRAVENTRTVLLVVEQEPYAKTCASVVVKLSAVSSQLSVSSQWPVASGQQKDRPAHARILAGLEIKSELVRSAAQRKKPVQSACSQWESRTEDKNFAI